MVGIVPRKHPLPSLDDSESTVKVKVTQLHLTLCDPMDYTYSPWNSPGQNTGVGSLSLLQGIFPAQGLNPGLPHCRWILSQMSHTGSPRILEWVDYSFSRGSSNPGIEPGSPALRADSLPTELPGKPWGVHYSVSWWFGVWFVRICSGIYITRLNIYSTFVENVPRSF